LKCPLCGRRHDPGIYYCESCRVSLGPAAEAPSRPAGTPPADDQTPGPGELVAVHRTADVAELPVISSLLQAAEIPFLVQGEHALALEPRGRLLGSGMGEIGAVVLVPAELAAEARELLRSTLDTPGDIEPLGDDVLVEDEDD
jgi:hypothetical protein